MKTFAQYVESRYGQFSDDRSITQKVTWDDAQGAFYDDNGTPFDSEPLMSFFERAAKELNVKDFEINLTFNVSGHSYPPNIGHPNDSAHDGGYDDRRTITSVTVTAQGNPVSTNTQIQKALMNRYHDAVNR